MPPVRIYLTARSLDIDPHLKICLIEQYANEEQPSDGEIYRKIRHYHYGKNYSFEMRWRARLRGSREKNLDGLLNDSDLTAAFDALLPIPGLWDGMMITTLHTMMSMKCDEVGMDIPGASICLYKIRKSYVTWAISNRSGTACFRKTSMP
jgi:hypothetical protein